MDRKHFRLFTILAACGVLCAACCSQRTFPAQTKRDTVRLYTYHTDSILLKDSVMVDRFIKGDTIYVTRVRWRIRDKTSVRVDTIYRSRTDTTFIKVPVEKKEGFIERATGMSEFLLVMAAIAALLIFWHNKLRGH